MGHITETVKQLIIINILFFVGAQFIGEDVSIELFALHYPENDRFRYWQVLTHMFMHGGLMHIFFNMYALYAFGSALEDFWGVKKFLFFYISCGLGAALLHILSSYYFFHQGLDALLNNGFSKTAIFDLLNQDKYSTGWSSVLGNDLDKFVNSFMLPAVGASGAIYGILVAFAFMIPEAELMLLFIPFPIKAKYFVPGLIGLDLFSGVTGFSIFGGNVAHFAHVGGALFGFIMMWYWKKNQFDKNRWDR